MLNGKFFSGLPPKMIDRREGSRGQNRQESHFFWPDDTQLDSVLETRVKRRNSLQLQPTERPRPLQQRASIAEGHEVDTRQMFHKEFAKSSIQFCDNIPEDADNSVTSNQPQHRPLRATKSMRQDITKKPTATRLELPESVVDAAYTSAKKKQAYTSTIQFYDYAEEDGNQRNNMRKPKMDMNDKRDVERNSKNSPKLQVKGNVRNLRREEKKNNDLRSLEPERSYEADRKTVVVGQTQQQQRIIREEAQPQKRAFIEENPVQYMPEQSYEPMRDTVASPQRIIRNVVFEERKPREEVQTHYIEEPIRSINYEHEVEIPEYRIGNTGLIEERRITERLPKKILKNITQDEMSRYGDYKKYRDEDLNDVNHIEHGMRNVRMRTSPKKHVTYRDETYVAEELPVRRSYYENVDGDEANFGNAYNSRAKLPNTKAGSGNGSGNGNSSGSTIRQQARPNTPDFIHAKNVDPYQYMEPTSSSTAKKSLNNRYNSYNNNINNSRSHQRFNNDPRKISPKITAAPAASTTTMSELSAADAQKHLRSSIGFNNGEIVADNDNYAATAAASSSTATAAKTPTANSSNSYRRNARNSAANKRVSVGLPDC